MKEEVEGGTEQEGDLTFPLFCRLLALVQWLSGGGEELESCTSLSMSKGMYYTIFVKEGNLYTFYPCVASESGLLVISAIPLTLSLGTLLMIILASF